MPRKMNRFHDFPGYKDYHHREPIDFSGQNGEMKKRFRIVLIAMCVLSAILGLVLCGVGVWILSSKDKIMSLFNLIDTQSLPMLEKYKTDMVDLIEKYDIISRVSLGFLMFGLLTIVLSAVGFYGSLRTSRRFLLVYAILLSALLISFLILTIVLAVSKDRIRAEMGNKLFLLQDKYLVSLVSMVHKPDTIKGLVTLALNFMHISLTCCGIRKVGDARNSTSWRGSERRIMKLLEEGAALGTKDKRIQGTPKPTSKTRTTTKKKPTKKPTRKTTPKPKSTAKTPVSQSDDLGDILDSNLKKDMPDWLKFDVPEKLTLPPKVRASVPDELPGGFEVDEKVFDDLGNTLNTVVEEATKVITEVFDDALTLRTPVTCCKLDGIKKLLQNEFDVQKMYDSLQDMSCVLEARNVGVNKKV